MTALTIQVTQLGAVSRLMSLCHVVTRPRYHVIKPSWTFYLNARPDVRLCCSVNILAVAHVVNVMVSGFTNSVNR